MIEKELNGVSNNPTVKKVFRFIDFEKREAINQFLVTSSARSYLEYTDFDSVSFAFLFREQEPLSDAFTNYSGFNYKHINNLLRGRWNYEENGNESRKEKYEELAKEMSEFIEQHPFSIGDTKVFRGVTLDYFREYGVSCKEDLKKLEGDYLLDSGFVSTSLLDCQSFYHKENELGLDYSVKIVYSVPEEFDDGVFLGPASYSPTQCEYLINSFNLARISSVFVNDSDTIIEAQLIPKRIYDSYYAEKKGPRK